MTMTFYSVVNKTGLAKLANALALNQPLNLSQIALGDGNGLPVVPSDTKQVLAREVYRANVQNLEPDPLNPGWFVASLIVPPDFGGWNITEGILYCSDGTVFANASLPPGYKATVAEGGIGEYIVDFVFQVSNAEAALIKLIVDPLLTIASRQWVNSNFATKAELESALAGFGDSIKPGVPVGGSDAPSDGTLIITAHGDYQLQASAEKSFLEVVLSQAVDLSAGKCRLLGPGTENINTKNGPYRAANLKRAGVYRFLRKDGKWNQL